MAPKRQVPDVWSALWRILTLPFSIAFSIIFYPIHLFIWIAVDNIGDAKFMPKSQWKQNFSQRPQIKDAIKFLKEFRYVLYDFGWPRIPSPAWRCKTCANEGEVWCVDCKKKFCRQCAYNQHVNTILNLHSLEPIVKEAGTTKGVHVLSDVLGELLLVCTICHLLTSDGWSLIREDYLTTQVTCPLVSSARSTVATFDANLFYYLKETLFSWCDMEDSFLRFPRDFWVRGIVTGTDNTLLVLQTLPKALLFDVVLLYTIVPVFAVIYAFLVNAVYQIERQLPRTPALVQFEQYVKYFAFLDFFDYGDFTTFPPETLERTRKAMDPYDAFSYWMKRNFRMFRYYYDSNMATLQSCTWHLLIYTMVARLACIWFNLSGILRGVLSCVGFGSKIRQQQAWFAGASDTFVDEQLLRHAAAKSYAMMKGVFVKSPKNLKILYGLFTFSVVVAFIVFFALCYYIMMKRREFMREYLSKDKSGSQHAALDFNQPLTLQARSAN